MAYFSGKWCDVCAGSRRDRRLPWTRRERPRWLYCRRVRRNPRSTGDSPLRAARKVGRRAKVDVRHVNSYDTRTRVRRCRISHRLQHTGTRFLPRLLCFAGLPRAGIVWAIRRRVVIVVAASLAPHRSLALPLSLQFQWLITPGVLFWRVDELESRLIQYVFAQTAIGRHRSHVASVAAHGSIP